MKKASLLLIVTVTAGFIFFSCGGGGGGGGSGSTGATQEYAYTSTDAANGYFNINGGQYRTITFNGTQQGGTVTLSNGTGSNLTGTYGEETSSRAAVSQSRVADASQLKGYFWVKFNGQTVGYTWTVTIIDYTIVIRGEALDGSIMHYAGSGSNVSIVPGSAEDPFNGTSWGDKTVSKDGTVIYTSKPFVTFTNGNISGSHFDEIVPASTDIDYATATTQVKLVYNRQKNYMVCKIAGGYKAYILAAEETFNSSAYNYNVHGWAVTWYTFIIENKDSETCSFGIDHHSNDNMYGEIEGGTDLITLDRL